MPFVIELQLRASWTVRMDTRQLHGLACALFEGEGAEHLGQDKPFTVWPLAPARSGASGEWELRAAWLGVGPPPAMALTSDELRLGHTRCTVVETVQRGVTHAQLAAGPPLSSVSLTFRSPTFFSQNGTDLVLPDPRLIVGSWRRHWNVSLAEAAALAIEENTWRETVRGLQLSEFDLRTERRDSGRGRERVGFAGSVTLRVAKDAPASGPAVLGTLARFAEFCGTGAQTTHGFGATSISGEPPRSGWELAGARIH